MSNPLHVFSNEQELLEGMWPTPLLKLRIGNDTWAKLEFYNPFSRSVKDRTAWFLFRQALLKNANHIVEATSGNTGIALASLSSIYGMQFTMFIPIVAPKVYKVFVKLLGGNVIEAGNSTNDVIPLVKRFAEMSNAVNLNQFNNPINVIAHYETTAREIDEQLSSIGKKPSRIIATMGTGGHIAGIAKYFKEKYGDYVEIVGVQPSENSRIPGIKRQNYSNSLLRDVKIDRVIDVSLEEAIDGTVNVARTSGILIGISAGATVAAYKKINDVSSTTVLIFPDDAFKYVDILEQTLKEI
ncbi:cysteine synthase family protein [Sulfolobus sp. E11-6]|uniref:cysteine synthase family protein n=1 Tax=Sulfolobus sp. E11-6 TaxID=2663020 RepID=UPI0012977E7C|nr:PLP-dependent cysteine synthase family protein [Sulfolobus sp. E11-6]QGA67686.1 pyridoxal-phosphate dependent enzyme [Sulfolobus sp. E11-6]